MKNIKLTLAYDGTDFSGFQIQSGQRTIQGLCQDVLSKITNENILLHGSGRTDAGVHALGQVCNFKTHSRIEPTKYRYIMQNFLPRDIVCLESQEVEMDFDARKSAHWKTYKYYLDHNPVPSILHSRFRTRFPYPLNYNAMLEGAQYLLGTHDFTSFCSVKTFVQNKTRTIYNVSIQQKPNLTIIVITGNGFLYNMVRIIVGTLCNVGRGNLAPDGIFAILQARDRTLAGRTMPPEGLFLSEVGY